MNFLDEIKNLKEQIKSKDKFDINWVFHLYATDLNGLDPYIIGMELFSYILNASDFMSL